MTDSKINPCSESTLISLLKWGMLSVKIPGYFPISVKTRSVKVLKYSKFQKLRHLSFSICSPQAIYTIMLLFLLTIWDLIFFARQSSFNKYLKARGPTEIYAYTFMLAISSVLGIYITIFGLRNGNKFLKFWKETCSIFDELQTQLNLNVNEGLEENGPLNSVAVQRFLQIAKTIRNSFLAVIIPTTLHVVIDYGVRIADSIIYDEDKSVEDTELALGLGFWTFFSLCGSSISVWMSSFIQFYTACLLAVQDTLKGSAELDNDENIKKFQSFPKDFQRQQNGYSSDVDELFSRVILHQQPKPKKPSQNGSLFVVQNHNFEPELEKHISVFQSILRGIDHFNEFFGVILIFEISACVFNLLVYLFFALVWLGRGEFGLLMETAVPIYIYGKELYDMGSYSEELTLAAESVVRAFGEHLPLDKLSHHMHLKLQMLATQVSASPPSISAKQFFIINRSLVTAIITSLLTFLVVLVQFRDADTKPKP